MDSTNLKKVQELIVQIKSWLKNYETGAFGSDAALSKEAAEMKATLAKAEKVLVLAEKKKGAVDNEWKESYDKLFAKLKGNALFANCFGNADDPLKDKEPLSVDQLKFAASIQKEAADWYGRFFDGEAASKEIKATVATIFERSKEILAAQKHQQADGQDLSIRYFGSDRGESRKVGQYVDKIASKFAGKVKIEKFEDKGEEAFRKKYNIEHLPTLIFKRKGKEFARHEGEISQSELEKKVNMMVEGATFSNSSKVVTLENQKTISDRELFALGEFVVLYFDTVWSGVCKKVGDSVKDEVLTLATKSNKTTTIKYQQITIDGRTKIHLKFHVDKIPTMIYLRDGKEVGRHEGYINPSALKEDMRRFLANGKVGNSSSNEVDMLGVKYDEKSASKAEVVENLASKLGGSVGEGGKNDSTDVYTVQVLLAQNGFRMKADGQISSELIYALKAYQSSLGLDSTGIVEPRSDTWDALNGKKIKVDKKAEDE